jgi:uncharacterized protein YbjT (DUF2867 family)
MTAIPSNRLVTLFGGSGFLGRNIVRVLANEGWRIRVAVRRPNLANYLKPAGRVGQIQLLKANALNLDAVAAAMKGTDIAINLIGVLAESGSQSFHALHVGAAKTIAEAAAAHKVARLLHVSALGASRDAPARYFQTKAEGEAAVRTAYPEATIFRPSLVFGPEDDFFNRFAALARMMPALPLIGGGHTRFQPVYVGDLADAAACVLANPDTAGKTYELGGPEVMDFRQVLELVLKEIHRKRLLIPVPFGLARVKAAFLGLLPKPLLTVDQVRMLMTDTVVSEDALTLRDLGIVPTAAEAIVPSYLWRFRKEGEFEAATG